MALMSTPSSFLICIAVLILRLQPPSFESADCRELLREYNVVAVELPDAFLE